MPPFQREFASRTKLAAYNPAEGAMNRQLRSTLVVLLFVTGVSFSVGQASAGHPISNSSDTFSPSGTAEIRAKAEAGDATAQLSLGTAYENGEGVGQNDERAALWYRRAAEQGNAAAQNRLGVMCRAGRGVEKSKEEAFKWYQRAARQKYASAMFNLGTAYYNGDGVGVDDTKSYAWFLLAKEAGSDAAADAVKRTESEIRPYQRVDAFTRIGDMYEKGEDLAQDHNEEATWYRRAAEEGGDEAQVKLASLLLKKGTDKDSEEARHWCEQAAKHPNMLGAYCMGLLCERGVGGKQDPGQAAKWYSDAGALGHAGALLRLGEMYWKGTGVKQDKEAAYGFILLASGAGVPDAQRDKEQMEREMDSKQVEKGHKKAADWVRAHGVALRLRKPAQGTSDNN